MKASPDVLYYLSHDLVNTEYDKKTIGEYWTELTFNYLQKYRMLF